MNTNQNSHNRSLLGMLLGAPEICPESTEWSILLSRYILKIHSLKRQSAPGVAHKIKKTNKGKLGRKSNHIARSKRTHTTLPCSCCA